MRCGKCKDEDVDISHVRACYGVQAPAGENPLFKAPAGVEARMGDDSLMDALDRAIDTARMHDAGLHEAPVSGNPPSDKQIAYVLGLQAERDTSGNRNWLDYDREALLRLDRPEVNVIINALKAMPRKSTGSRAWTMPDGRYALKDDAAGWMFFEVSKPDKGRWAGYVFVNRLIGAPGNYRKQPMREASNRNAVLARIEADPNQAMTDFGLQSGTCGMCSSPLTNAESLARGIGPVCLAKSGWV